MLRRFGRTGGQSRRARPRHILFSAVLIVSVALGVGLWAFWLEPASLTVANESIVIGERSSRLIRIGILADLHIGSPFNGLAKLRGVVERTNAANIDLICILGDLVIHGVIGGRFVDPEGIAAELSRLRAPLGVVAVLGNHDDWFDHERVKTALEHNGIRVLDDSAVKVSAPPGPLWIAGISDLWTGRHDIPGALAQVQDDDPVLLLTHNPDVFPFVPSRVALTVAGHTHGGQVLLPFFGRPIVPSRFGQRFAAGHVVEDGRHLFVATGVGTSIVPVRFRVPPAVTILEVIGAWK